jgi:hypothetical protein
MPVTLAGDSVLGPPGMTGMSIVPGGALVLGLPEVKGMSVAPGGALVLGLPEMSVSHAGALTLGGNAMGRCGDARRATG